MNDNGLESFSDYRIIRLLGEGGMGRVYLARKSFGGFEMECVLKTIRPGLAERERSERMFLQEAKVTASLRHQNIVQILDFGKSNDELYMAMEYVEGANLAEILRVGRQRNKPLPPAIALRITAEVLKGLQHAHNRKDQNGKELKIVHRDLTPNNILISDEGEVKITDFGIAKSAFSETRTQTGELKGKFHYLSPEMIESAGIDRRTDLFSTGVVLYEMLTDEKPFTADSLSSLLAKIVRCDYIPATKRASLPKEIDDLLSRVICADKENRFDSAASMLDAVEDILRVLPPGPATSIRGYIDDLKKEGPFAPPFIHEVPVRHVGATRTGRLSFSGKGAIPGGNGVVQKRKRTAIIAASILLMTILVLLLFQKRVFTDRIGTEKEYVPAAVEETPVPSSALPPAPVKSVATATPPKKPEPTPPKKAAPVALPGPEKTEAPIDKPASPCVLKIGTLDPWADIYVDGVLKDQTPAKMEIGPGKHSVKLVNPKLGKSAVFNITCAGEPLKIAKWPE